MPRYIIERQYLMPVYQHLAIEAPDFEAACREAMDERKHSWEGAVDDPEGARGHHLTNAVEIVDQQAWLDATQASERPRLLYDEGRDPLPIPDEFKDDD